MLSGRFAIAGWYTNVVPGCTVLPIVEVCVAKGRFPFGGYMEISAEGKVTGTIVDKYGQAKIEGEIGKYGLTFKKKYATGAPVKHDQAPLEYCLTSAGGTLLFTGEFRFSGEERTEDGRVVLQLVACTL
ncbi:hypothetical protein KKB10_05505 [Patescibacteria group bacterium]|nr:hypothetical protein [Patescibacteria group bacterium]MBU1075351.1 hypothetical protein [Patescibacteria group bacterium]MBU1951716.1 hypothetical protein [Patescibacteria group bacterium]